eukprot:SAG31_NODE_7_length_42755_cov_130.245728_27_plen_196_part_00
MVPSDRTGRPAAALADAQMTADMAATGRPVVSFGLHASEGRKTDGTGPFPPGPFAPAFATATAAGLIATPHAGEHLGAESCVAAVQALGAARLLHGVRAVEDPATLQLLARRGICCDVCPTSNVLLNVEGCPSLREHPLPILLAAGVPCSINCDVRALFLQLHDHCHLLFVNDNASKIHLQVLAGFFGVWCLHCG